MIIKICNNNLHMDFVGGDFLLFTINGQSYFLEINNGSLTVLLTCNFQPEIEYEESHAKIIGIDIL